MIFNLTSDGEHILGNDTIFEGIQVLVALTEGDKEVNINLVDDEEMFELNHQWRKKESSTDVLSFSAEENGIMPGTEHILGDIIVNYELAHERAKELGHRFEEEVMVLIVHGLLHLMGYDHEKNASEAKRQLDEEIRLLNAMNIKSEIALIGRTG